MQTENTKEKIESYLQGQMNPVEREAFEKDLRNDPALRKSLTASLLRSLKKNSDEDEETRALLRSVYDTMPKLNEEEPKKTGINRFLSKLWIPYMAAASTIVAVVYFTLFYQQGGGQNNGDMYASMMATPVSMERASVGDMAFNEKASFFYFQDQPMIDSLAPMALACNGFCVPKYYLAHAYLKTGQFDKANALFGELLSDVQRINDVPQLQGREQELRFNALVAKAAATGDRTKVHSELMKLIQELKKSDSLYNLAIRFRGALQ